MGKNIRLLVAIVLLFFLLHSLQRGYNKFSTPSSPAEDFKYLPSGTFLKGAALSFDEMLADLLWIKAIGYFGGHARTDRNFQWLGRLLVVTTTLDPYFDDPYEFGGIVLAAELNDISGSTELLKKGMANVPKHHKRYWYLPFFTAFNYMYYKGNYEQAAHYLEIAASFPQRPAYLPLLVARLYGNTNDPGIAIPFLEKMMERAGTAEMREKLARRIREITVKKHILMLTRARDQFKKLTGKWPKTLQDIVTRGIIKKVPAEPLGGHYFISVSDHAIRTSSDADDMELHIKTPPPAQAKNTKINIPFMLREYK